MGCRPRTASPSPLVSDCGRILPSGEQPPVRSERFVCTMPADGSFRQASRHLREARGLCAPCPRTDPSGRRAAACAKREVCVHHARGHGSFRQASSRLRKAKGLCAPCPRTTTNKLRMTSKPTDFLVIPLFPYAAPWPQTTADGSCKSAAYSRLPRACSTRKSADGSCKTAAYSRLPRVCSARDQLTVAASLQPIPGCPGHAQQGISRR